VTEYRADELLALPVRLHGIPLGRPADFLLDRDELKAVGFDVLCGDDVHRFLPLGATNVVVDELAISSPFVLLEEDELEFYRLRTFALGTLRGTPVLRDREDVGMLRDVVVRTDGSVSELIVVDGDERERRVRFDDSVRLGQSDGRTTELVS
jgi:hypothetical protein